ncbi:MAG: excisionase family DNA-binding protein [Acidimicrobiia bacterium]
MSAKVLPSHVFTPTDDLEERQELKALESLVDRIKRAPIEPETHGRAYLVGPDGSKLVLPNQVFEVIRNVVEVMTEGQSVIIAPVHQRLTTQEAAELLGISWPTLVKLLDEGEIPFEPLDRHRRILLTDVLAYQQQLMTNRREALDCLVEISEEVGLYEKTATPLKTR